jgi:dTDP-4-dehydrorhamnose reductase
MTVLVLGAGGLLGNAMFRVLSEPGDRPVFGTLRNAALRPYFTPRLRERLVTVEDLEDPAQIIALFDTVQPTTVVNCIALGRAHWSDYARMIAVFALLPRRLSHLCRLSGIRLIQISSDGVFRGTRGAYSESDIPDADDAYGVAKLLGEINEPGAITLRTSMIGHDLLAKSGLLEWFLSQRDECQGHTRAIFSGFPTIVLAQIVRDVILPRPDLQGIYHLATQPISKFDLLHLISRQYGTATRLVPDDRIVIDRSLCADRFNRATGYEPPAWPELIASMHSYKFGLKDGQCSTTR